MDLDRIDRKLLELLLRDGRARASTLAEMVNLSARATLARIRDLERRGCIRGYHAQLGFPATGRYVSLFAEIALKGHERTTIASFEKTVLAAPEVVACYLVSGRYDYLVRLGCRDLAHYHDLTASWLNDPGLGIEKIGSSTELRTVKEFAGFSVQAE